MSVTDFLVKAQGVNLGEPKSPLTRAPWDRKVDIFKLARMGESASVRLWNDFAQESPQVARLVKADVELDERANRKATKQVDKVLTKSESKPKKAKNLNALKANKSASKGEARETAAYLRSLLSSNDPSIREAARNALGL